MPKGLCPTCETELSVTGICADCGGSLRGLAVLNLVCPEGYVKKCLDHVTTHGLDSTKTCPHCATAMKAVFPPDCEPALELDFCMNCRAVWFDPGEVQSLPKKSKLEKARIEATRLEASVKKRRRDEEEEQEAKRARSGEDGLLLATILMMD